MVKVSDSRYKFETKSKRNSEQPISSPSWIWIWVNKILSDSFLTLMAMSGAWGVVDSGLHWGRWMTMWLKEKNVPGKKGKKKGWSLLLPIGMTTMLLFLPTDFRSACFCISPLEASSLPSKLVNHDHSGSIECLKKGMIFAENQLPICCSSRTCHCRLQPAKPAWHSIQSLLRWFKMDRKIL